jgi:ribonucleotide reductase alpha subunit
MTKEPQLISDDTQENDQLFNFMERLIFDILSMTSENKQLIELTKLYTQMLYKNSTQAFKLIEKRILLKDREAKEQREFFESLIQHMDKDVRDMNSMILLACVNVCFEKDNRELIDLIMNQVFSLMPEELSKNWLKVH